MARGSGDNDEQAAGRPPPRDRKHAARLRDGARLAREAAQDAAKASEWLLPLDGAGTLEAEGMERTYRFSQAALAAAAPSGAAATAFDLQLDPRLGPYGVDYTHDGRHLLLAGRRGHLCVADWGRGTVRCELQARDTTRAAVFLHSANFFAAAQSKYVYIYDGRGQEVHCCREHEAPLALAFLRPFFLLASAGDGGVLRWQDTGTGALVGSHRTRLGRCAVLAANPASGVLVAGHAGGTATLWSPNQGAPLASLLAHRGPVTACCCDPTGRLLVTAGADSQLKVWDLRTFAPLHAYFTQRPAACAAVSQRGLLGVGYGPHVQVWPGPLGAKAASPLLTHLAAGGGSAVEALRFCPYQDVLGVGHAGGFASLMVPGAGEPNFDSRVADPFGSKKARTEAEVRALLDKLPPAMISLDPDSVAGVAREPRAVAAERRAAAEAADGAARAAARAKTDARAKAKGRRRASRVHRRKQLNVVEERRGKAVGGGAKGGGAKGSGGKAAAAAVTADAGGAAEAKEAKRAARTAAAEAADAAGLPLALRRFVKAL